MSLQTVVLIFVNYSVWFLLSLLVIFIIFHSFFSDQFLCKIDHKDHVIFFLTFSSGVCGFSNRITTDKQTLFKIYEEKSFYETELYSQIWKIRSCMDYSLSRIISRSNNKEVDRNIYDP